MPAHTNGADSQDNDDGKGETGGLAVIHPQPHRAESPRAAQCRDRVEIDAKDAWNALGEEIAQDAAADGGEHGENRVPKMSIFAVSPTSAPESANASVPMTSKTIHV